MKSQLTAPETVEKIQRFGQDDPAVTFLAQELGNI